MCISESVMSCDLQHDRGRGLHIACVCACVCMLTVLLELQQGGQSDSHVFHMEVS